MKKELVFGLLLLVLFLVSCTSNAKENLEDEYNALQPKEKENPTNLKVDCPLTPELVHRYCGQDLELIKTGDYAKIQYDNTQTCGAKQKDETDGMLEVHYTFRGIWDQSVKEFVLKQQGLKELSGFGDEAWLYGNTLTKYIVIRKGNDHHMIFLSQFNRAERTKEYCTNSQFEALSKEIADTI